MSEPIGAHAVPDDETGPSDLDLVERTRAGDSRAFAELWNRHSRAGRTVARSFSSDADDIVSESFAKVLQAIRNGGGPTSAFRPYLFSTIRNVAMQLKRGAQIDTSDELDALADPTSEEAETLLALDKSLTAQAFRSLPTRWQEALWYSEVEQLASHEIAPLLGMTSNAVSALTFRAREGLRQAWIGAHLVRAADTECAAIIEKLGSYTRGSLGARETRKVQQHLASCAACSIVDEEARDVGSRLTLVLLPLAAGIAGAAAYTVSMQGGGSAAVAAAASTLHPGSAAAAHAAAAPVAHAASAPVAHAASGPLAHAASGPLAHAASAPVAHATSVPVAHATSVPAAHLSPVSSAPAVSAPAQVAPASVGPSHTSGGHTSTPAAVAHHQPARGDADGMRAAGGRETGGVIRPAAYPRSGIAGATRRGIISVFPRARTAVGFALATAAAVGAAFLLSPLLSSPTPTSLEAAPSSASSSDGGRVADASAALSNAKLAAGSIAARQHPVTPESATGDGETDPSASLDETSMRGGSVSGSDAPGDADPGAETAGSPSAPSGATAAAPAAPTNSPAPNDPGNPPTPPTTFPTIPPEPTLPPTAPPDPPAVPPAPEAHLSVDPDGRLFPIADGHALPGAAVEVVDLAGHSASAQGVTGMVAASDTSVLTGVVVAETRADSHDGSFTIDDFPDLTFGEHRLALRQIGSDGTRSELSAETQLSLSPITLVDPVAGATLEGANYIVNARGDADAMVEQLLDGVPDPRTFSFNSDGNLSAEFASPAPSGSSSTVALRYTDPDTGRHGPAATAQVTFPG